ncbi:DNA repair protein complementing XP-C cells homolog [Uranotaenia lowii]|uniref:DNA repair protein complementing XP-C cells homolog n=1 Tax=Uranotaenia lowii TaxID=190385 RepID=UPI0024790120|nr:DNA repair protein complementing XP-C cells homolog [Uranotaenia lowii]
MSSEDDISDDGGDFSASEDEWLPGKSNDKKKKSRTSDEADSDSVASDEMAKISNTGRTGKRGLRKVLVMRKGTSTNNSVAQTKKKATKKQNDSDSSGDEHLVNPDQIDLRSDFFSSPPAAVASSSKVPTFDCNAGMRLSDSSDNDDDDDGHHLLQKQKISEEIKQAANKKLIAKINKTSESMVTFAGHSEFNKKMEQAHAHLVSSNSVKLSRLPEELEDVGNLLALGEPKANSDDDKKAAKPVKRKNESDSDWEDVEENKETKPVHDVQITIGSRSDEVVKKKRNNEFDMEVCIKRIINRERKENQTVLHKVNILMAIGHGNVVNNVLNSAKLFSLALTLIPAQKCYPKDRTNIEYFEQITKFFRQIIDLKDRREFCRFKKLPILETSLRLQMLTKAAICKRDFVLIFIILLRAIGIQCRLVMSLVVVPKKVSQPELAISPTISAENKSKSGSTNKASTGKTQTKLKDIDYSLESNSSQTSRKSNKKSGAGSKRAHLQIPQLDGNDDESSDVPAKKSKKRVVPSRTQKTTEDRLQPSTSLQEINLFSPRKTRKQRTADASVTNERPKVVETSSSKKPNSVKSLYIETKERSVNQKLDVKKETVVKASSSSAKEKLSVTENVYPSKSKSSNVRVSSVKSSTRESKSKSKPIVADKPRISSTCSLQSKSTKTPKSSEEKVPKKILKIEYVDHKLKRRLDRRILSTDDEMAPGCSKPKGTSSLNVWIEVFAEEEEQWVPVDVTSGKVHCLEHVIKQASSPIVYVLAWNNDGSIKDVSARYCPNFATSTKKLRIEDEWLEETLTSFKGQRTARDIEEDRSLNRALQEQPLPTAIGDYKNHPLYALKRHLLKFEGIYPENAPTLGFIRGEPVYARECVHTLHSREIWLKQARTVKMFETAYKVVNARPKYDRASGQMLAAQPLELFGYWQTQDYEPPTAEDGIVPRNAYGNVELFKPCMLPKKTVHLQLPALNRICKKLRIDCAQAVTGFDFHGGSSHPVYDGYVVCEEFRDLVVDAWYQEQEEEEKREREKFEKRVYGNWKKLIKGLLIRRKLQNKYNFDNLSG